MAAFAFRTSMRLPRAAHTSRPWLIHEIAPEFEILDVWALPTPGGRDDFERLVQLVTSFDPAGSESWLVRILFVIRRRLGNLLGWDDPATGLDARVPSLRERVPPELRDSASRLEVERAPFSPLYVTHDEFAAEIANATVHGVLHVGWVPDGDTFGGQLAVLVKPNGSLGRVYLASIVPFRHLIVYPTMIDEIGRLWERTTPTTVR